MVRLKYKHGVTAQHDRRGRNVAQRRLPIPDYDPNCEALDAAADDADDVGS